MEKVSFHVINFIKQPRFLEKFWNVGKLTRITNTLESNSVFSSPPHLICYAAVRPCVPWNEVCDQPLHPAAVLGAQVLSRQPHIPVRTGSQHGEEGHQVTVPVHRELCRWSRPAGVAGETRSLFMWLNKMQINRSPGIVHLNT